MKKLLMVFIFLLINMTANAQTISENRTEKYYEFIQNKPVLLQSFLYHMPKGGDLHSHQSGATFAENLIRYAKDDNFCIDRQTYTIFTDANCAKDNFLNTAIQNDKFYHAIIDAWSMRHFQFGKESGHDHFFAAFGKFNAITKKHHGEMLAEISERAALQNEQYLELMMTLDDNESGKLGKQLGWDNDFDAMRKKLLAENFDKILNRISTTLDQDEAKAKTILACQSKHPKAGCNIKVRYLYQVLREQPPEMIFAQLLAGFEAASKDHRIVGLNMVQPEDGPISMKDYKLQMQMVGFLHKLYPHVQVSLHAGELNDSLVSQEGLKFHIHDAVDVANANRIGHGVDILQEDNADQLLKEMADKQVMVEINLSSNEAILNVKGKQHPISAYMNYGVPVALSTDDEGVSRDDLTTQYVKAVTNYHFSYSTLKTLVRNSISYSFAPGKKLWADRHYQHVITECAKDVLGSDHVSSSCRAFLDANEKASMQWELEKRFTAFENRL